MYTNCYFNVWQISQQIRSRLPLAGTGAFLLEYTISFIFTHIHMCIGILALVSSSLLHTCLSRKRPQNQLNTRSSAQLANVYTFNIGCQSHLVF